MVRKSRSFCVFGVSERVRSSIRSRRRNRNTVFIFGMASNTASSYFQSCEHARHLNFVCAFPIDFFRRFVSCFQDHGTKQPTDLWSPIGLCWSSKLDQKISKASCSMSVFRKRTLDHLQLTYTRSSGSSRPTPRMLEACLKTTTCV